jgi:hypothetical protein
MKRMIKAIFLYIQSGTRRKDEPKDNQDSGEF